MLLEPQPESWAGAEEAKAAIQAIHQAIGKKAGLELHKSSVQFSSQPDIFRYSVNGSRPEEIKERFTRALEEVKAMSPEELANFTKQINIDVQIERELKTPMRLPSQEHEDFPAGGVPQSAKSRKIQI